MLKLIVSIIGAAIALSPSAIGFKAVNGTDNSPRYGSSFQGGTIQYREDRTIYYSTDKTIEYENPYGVSSFVPSMPNSCVIEAAGNAIVYYDRLYNELVPDYQGKYNIRGDYTYGKQNDGVNRMFQELSTAMGSDSEGTTVNGFVGGVKSYVSGKGRTATLTKATGSYFNISYDYLKNQLEQEKVAVVFLNGCAIVDIRTGIQSNDGYDVVSNTVMSGHHSMLIYGYKDIYYYDSKGNITERDTYLYAEDAYGGHSYLTVDNYSVIDDIYILDIK